MQKFVRISPEQGRQTGVGWGKQADLLVDRHLIVSKSG